MKPINLLFITKDRKDQLERSTHYLIEELKKNQYHRLDKTWQFARHFKADSDKTGFYFVK